MAEIITTLSALGTKLMTAAGGSAGLLGKIGTLASAGATIYSGYQAKQDANFEAKQLKRKGDDEFAAGQREAMRRRRETDMILSRQKAVAAASGGGATDPTVEAIMGKTVEEGEYSAMMDMYNGAINRADLHAEAKQRKRGGKNAFTASFFNAGKTIYSGFAGSGRQQSYSSLYD